MRGFSSYKRNNIESAPNEELIVLLVEGALHRIDRADAAMAEGNRSAWTKDLHTARAIYTELLGAFDPDAPPELSGPVCNTYRWLILHLVQADRNGDRAKLSEIREVAVTMVETWTRALRIHRGEDGGEGG
jgi:flagellar biosynthetic protein FliS